MDDVSEKSRKKKNKVKREKIETIDVRKAVYCNIFSVNR